MLACEHWKTAAQGSLSHALSRSTSHAQSPSTLTLNPILTLTLTLRPPVLSVKGARKAQGVGFMVDSSAVERMWHIKESQGQILALALM